MELEDFLKEMLLLRLDIVITPIWPGIYLKPDELQLTTERRRHTSGSCVLQACEGLLLLQNLNAIRSFQIQLYISASPTGVAIRWCHWVGN